MVSRWLDLFVRPDSLERGRWFGLAELFPQRFVPGTGLLAIACASHEGALIYL